MPSLKPMLTFLEYDQVQIEEVVCEKSKWETDGG